MATSMNSAPTSLADQIRQQWGGYGDWDVGGVDRAGELAEMLRKSGVESLGDMSFLGSQQMVAREGGLQENGPEYDNKTLNQLKIGGKTLGYLGNYEQGAGVSGWQPEQFLKERSDGQLLGYSSQGSGETQFIVKTDPTTGKMYVEPKNRSTSVAPMLRRAGIGLAAMAGGGYLLSGMLGAGGAAASAATTGGAANGALATNAALIESALGTAGYGASSANLIGGGAGSLSWFGGGSAFTDPTLAKWADTALSWLGNQTAINSGGSDFGNGLVRDLMKLIGAGVSQHSAENATKEQREWIEKQASDKRRRGMPVARPGMLYTTSRGG